MLRRLTRAALLVLAVTARCLAADPQTRVEVSFTGIEGAALANVEQSVTLERQKDNPRLSDGRVRVLFARAPAEIRSALQALGYYRSTIGSSIDESDGVWRARFSIDPGPPLMVRSLDVTLEGEAREDPAFAQLLAAFPLKIGAHMHHGRYAEGKRALERLATDRGYFDAHFSVSEIRIDLEAYAADVRIVYATGQRYHFGEIALPDTVLKPAFLERFLQLRSGQPYLSSALLETESALKNSDYFASVRVSAQRERAVDFAVPVSVELEPKKPNRYTMGAGFGTDTGPRARLGWERRYMTRGGHRLSTDLSVSPVINNLSARYVIPIRDPRTDRLTLSGSISREDTDSSKSWTYRVGAARSAPRWGWGETLSIDYEFEDFDVAGVSETASLLIPSARYLRVWADDRLHVKRGLRLAFGVEGAHDYLLSDVSFVKADLSAKYIHELFDAGRILLRADMGALASSDFDALSATHRFFAGGDNSIRGFDFESLGPKDDAGEVVGGHYLAVGSVEYEHVVKGNWSAAVFTDFGNAFDDFSEDLEIGVGVGVRWRSPVGPVRLDVATGISEPDYPVRLHIVIGPDL